MAIHIRERVKMAIHINDGDKMAIQAHGLAIERSRQDGFNIVEGGEKGRNEFTPADGAVRSESVMQRVSTAKERELSKTAVRDPACLSHHGASSRAAIMYMPATTRRLVRCPMKHGPLNAFPPSRRPSASSTSLSAGKSFAEMPCRRRHSGTKSMRLTSLGLFLSKVACAPVERSGKT